jgi:hypothetical protein
VLADAGKSDTDVSRYARAALVALLEGFRARDGFLALQTREEYQAACSAAGEVCTTLCSRFIIIIFTLPAQAGLWAA